MSIKYVHVPGEAELTRQRQTDEQFMRRAIGLAMRGRGYVEPNPMVGCVIVKEGVVVGEGCHEKFGGPHAEPNALRAVSEGGGSAAGGTAYVTLEPCCHVNKKTPPCVPALIEAKVGRVVVGCEDPNPEVAGRGVSLLREAGIQVEVGVLGGECKQLIAPYTARVQGRTPYLTLKWAESADGKVAGPSGRRMQITNPAASRVVHQLRADSDVILVGIGTVLEDDPMLTPRGMEVKRPLLRVVLDSSLRTPVASRLARTAREVPVRIYCDPRLGASTERRGALEALGIQVVTDEAWIHPVHRLVGALAHLRDHDHPTHVMVEAGPTIARFFLAGRGAADRLWCFQSPMIIGGEDAPKAPSCDRADWVMAGQTNIEGDVLSEYLNIDSANYHATTPSADLVRVADGRPSE